MAGEKRNPKQLPMSSTMKHLSGSMSRSNPRCSWWPFPGLSFGRDILAPLLGGPDRLENPHRSGAIYDEIPQSIKEMRGRPGRRRGNECRAGLPPRLGLGGRCGGVPTSSRVLSRDCLVEGHPDDSCSIRRLLEPRTEAGQAAQTCIRPEQLGAVQFRASRHRRAGCTVCGSRPSRHPVRVHHPVGVYLSLLANAVEQRDLIGRQVKVSGAEVIV